MRNIYVPTFIQTISIQVFIMIHFLFIGWVFSILFAERNQLIVRDCQNLTQGIMAINQQPATTLGEPSNSSTFKGKKKQWFVDSYFFQTYAQGAQALVFLTIG